MRHTRPAFSHWLLVDAWQQVCRRRRSRDSGLLSVVPIRIADDYRFFQQRPDRSTIEHAPTDFVAQPLVVEHQLPYLAWKLCSLPLARQATGFFGPVAWPWGESWLYSSLTFFVFHGYVFINVEHTRVNTAPATTAQAGCGSVRTSRPVAAVS